ncbi:hypothetical protein [Spirosoma jeollabukense]
MSEHRRMVACSYAAKFETVRHPHVARGTPARFNKEVAFFAKGQ